MNSPTLSFLSLTTLSLILQFPISLTNPDASFYHICGNTFNCGSITGIAYPFRRYQDPEYCGYPGLSLYCQDNIATINITNVKYRVLDINQATQTMTIAREDILESVCPRDLVNTTLDNSLFEYASSVFNLDFVYGCPISFSFIITSLMIPIPSCNISGFSVYLVVGNWGPDLSCKSRVTVPVAGWDGSLDLKNLGQAVQGGFKVRWKVDSKGCNECTGSKGRCGFDSVTGKPLAFAPTRLTCRVPAQWLPEPYPQRPH